MHPRAGCLFTDEYLMGLNGDLRRRSVALSFPTHTTGGVVGVPVRLCVHSGSPAPRPPPHLVDAVALSCRVTQQLPLISSYRSQGEL